ncbi:hypothetical protein BH93_02480 [Rhodococcoides fascians A25f]|uniref:GTP pyrophosphokinase n=1 Tax=Rhodococcoides fascians TaxID=1828 RepID=UPI00056409B1|nr:hypothetical protein [Rhodococcus fascians]QII04381.1 hypothetical protein BH93_02480 [Rhodococcus fascians A25f]
MSSGDLPTAYANYVSTQIRPLQDRLKKVFKAWEREEFWAEERQGSQITIPSPIQRTYSRVKRLESVEDKAKKNDLDLQNHPVVVMNAMSDMLGARVVTYVTNNIPLIDRAIARTPELELSKHTKPKFYLPKDTMDRLALDSERFDISEVKDTGYSSVHYVLQYVGDASREYPEFELQVRTMLIEAWGEIEHKFAYKPSSSPEIGVRRQLRIVADHLRAIDSHFDLIHDRLQYLRGISNPGDRDLVDEVNITRIFAEVQIPLREKDVVPLLSILYDNDLTDIGSLRARLKPEIILELKKQLALLEPPQELTGFHLISTVVNLNANSSAAEAKAELLRRLESVEASRIRFD